MVPIFALAAVFVIAAVVLGLDARQKRLLRRVETISDIARQRDADIEQARSIRLGRQRRSLLCTLTCKTLRIPTSIPDANVIPIWLVLFFGVAAGVGAVWLARFYLQPVPAVIAGIAVGTVVPRGIFAWEYGRYQ